ncbi:MAG: PEP-CTERM sorting domain-containing protein [Gammaproteobacteria bacterium]|nr:PEP-CTERM sorting domain-containing protein [Gammaproteobacteria bacterium]
MKRLILSAVAATSIGLSASAGAFTLTFEDQMPSGYRFLPADDAIVDGFAISLSSFSVGNVFFVDSNAASGSLDDPPPLNGTDILAVSGPGSITLSNADGFSVTSVDLSGFQPDVPGQTISIMAELLNGGTSFTSFLYDDIADGPEIHDFQTFSFPAAGFQSTILSSITFTATSAGFALDNLVGTSATTLPLPIPEPSTAAMLGLGFALVGFKRKFKRA